MDIVDHRAHQGGVDHGVTGQKQHDRTPELVVVEVSGQSRALHGLRRDLIATHAQYLNPAQIVGDGLAVVSQHELVGPAPRQMNGCLDVSYAAAGPDMDEPLLLFNRPLAAFREPGLVQKCGHVVFGEQMPSQRGELVDPLGLAIFLDLRAPLFRLTNS